MELVRRIQFYLIKLNLFPSDRPSTDPTTLQNQRIATRFFICISICSMLVILIYLCMMHSTRTITIETPTYDDYSHLYAEQSDTLICPCSKISIDYGQLVQIRTTPHQVCSSEFITDDWIEYLKQAMIQGHRYFLEDFRISGISLFQGLRSFCQMTNRTIHDSLVRFYANQYVTTTVISTDLFKIQMQLFFDQYVSSTTNHLRFSLELTRNMIHVNGLWSARLFNFFMYFLADQSFTISAAMIINNCRCNLSPSCTTNFAIMDTNGALVHIIPGLFLGCILTEALLQSDLRCFYNHTCIIELQRYIDKLAPRPFLPLNSSVTSRFLTTSTVRELMNGLMVETWNRSFSHETYYYQCRPTICTYTYVDRYSTLYIVTTLFSLFGGLITILRVVIPFLVIHGRHKLEDLKHRRRRSKWFFQL